MSEKEKTKEKTKLEQMQEALGKDGTAEEDAALAAELLDEEGNIKVDLSLPAEFELDIMAGQLLQHLTSYKQLYHARRAARGSGDHVQAEKLGKQMQYNQLTAAVIQRAYPKAKKLADTLAIIQAKQTSANRQKQLDEGK